MGPFGDAHTKRRGPLSPLQALDSVLLGSETDSLDLSAHISKSNR